ncbi:MAG: M20/M25/M40 family metallo-hydrolase [Thiohalomonadales bacterium]
MAINHKSVETFVNNFWDGNITPTLEEYIRIPALSPDFDDDWQAHGHLQNALQLALNWLQRHCPEHWHVIEKKIDDRTPLLLVEIPGVPGDPVLMYGHLDKQPEMEGWKEGYGPWIPVINDGKLYGRGGADDGYALFAAVAAIKALEEQQVPHAPIVILIEFSEESGSPDLPAYLDQCTDIIGSPKLVIALDSGAGDYDRLWSTTSLRGMLSCVLKVEVLNEATHSGIASGIVPSSMRIARQLLERLESSSTGEVLLPELQPDVPMQRLQQIEAIAEIIGDDLLLSFNSVPNLCAVSDDPVELLLNNTWRPTLCVVGQQGMPAIKDAGNVMRAYTSLKLSFRLPPNIKWRQARQAIEAAILADPPYQSRVSIDFDQGGDGWDAPPLADWLQRACSEASQQYYGNDAAYFGLGASIPFMAMLGDMYPKAQFLITGVLGPQSNAHGPNEFIHLAYAKRLTCCISLILSQTTN